MLKTITDNSVKKTIIIIASILISGFCAGLLLPKEDLLPQHKEWLLTVSPIITKTEREIFLKLRTPEERDKFIQFFWRQRDPYPDTAENEFQKEYMKRVDFADQNFHDPGPKGSRTERGYYYLLLGPPLERNIFATQSEIYPLELWFYKGEEKYGLPDFFYLIFYQPGGNGEYRLYSPGIEGPEKLVSPAAQTSTPTRTSAYQVIKKINSELANASLSYLPGDQPYGLASFSSDSIISGVRALPEKKFSDAYARSYLNYKDYVEVDYSHNFTQSDFEVKVFESGQQPFIHWTCEPQKMNFAQRTDKYYANFELILRMEDPQGNPVFEKTEEIPLQLTEEQYKTHEREHFAFQDIFPVVSGRFKLFFLLKNKTGKDFTSGETEVTVLEDNGAPRLSNLILYHGRQRIADSQKNYLKAFSFEGNQYLLNARNDFLPQGALGCYAQVYHLDEKLKNGQATVLFEIVSPAPRTVTLSLKRSLSEVLSPAGGGIDVNGVALASLKPGYYEAHLSLVDDHGRTVLSGKENLIILAQAYPVLPWAYSKVHNPFPDPEQLYTLGSQYFMTRNYGQAKRLLEQSLKFKDDPGARLLLGKTLFAMNDYQGSLALVVPVYQAEKNREAAKVIALDYAGLKDWASALVYLEKLMQEATEVAVLNLAAECYLNLSQPEKALPLLQKSLQLDPSQPRIKELEAKAKKLKEK